MHERFETVGALRVGGGSGSSDGPGMQYARVWWRAATRVIGSGAERKRYNARQPRGCRRQ